MFTFYRWLHVALSLAYALYYLTQSKKLVSFILSFLLCITLFLLFLSPFSFLFHGPSSHLSFLRNQFEVTRSIISILFSLLLPFHSSLFPHIRVSRGVCLSLSLLLSIHFLFRPSSFSLSLVLLESNRCVSRRPLCFSLSILPSDRWLSFLRFCFKPVPETRGCAKIATFGAGQATQIQRYVFSRHSFFLSLACVSGFSLPLSCANCSFPVLLQIGSACCSVTSSTRKIVRQLLSSLSFFFSFLLARVTWRCIVHVSSPGSRSS